jgi:hypothetical protein
MPSLSPASLVIESFDDDDTTTSPTAPVLNIGDSVACGTSTVYRVVGTNHLRPYPNPQVAASWNSDWAKNIKQVNCQNYIIGEDMQMNTGSQLTPQEESSCINQAQATMVLLDTNNLCNKPSAEEQNKQKIEAGEVVLSELETRLAMIMKQIGTNTNYMDAANKASAAAQHLTSAADAASGQTSQLLSKYNGDTMTAERVATLSQQDLLHTSVVVDYMQICCIVFAAGIVIMFPFAFGIVRSFFKHPNAFMQFLLILGTVAALVVIILRLWANRNHYRMLYQERVFDYNRIDETKPDCDCTTPSVTVSPVVPIAKAAGDEVCSA